MDIVITLIVLIMLLDIVAIWSIIRSKYTHNLKILYALIILFCPIIGVTIYYLIELIRNKK